jgi:uncharacterized membrane protein
MLAAPVGSDVDRNRASSIQAEDDFFAKPYGELKAATPPIIVGGGGGGGGGGMCGLILILY